MRLSPQSGPRAGLRGFTYLGLLFAIAIMGAVLAATGVLWHTARQREKERDLLFVGDHFRRAIGLYYQRTPGPVKRFPKSLDALLKDNRYVTTQRYLRKIYFDPMTDKQEWGLVQAPGGGIMGVYSLSRETPFKRANFGPGPDSRFAGKTRYSDWRFVYQPPGAPSAQQPASPKK